MNTLSYLNLVTSEHRLKPKYIQMLTDTFDMYTDLANNTGEISTLFDIDAAYGNELDIIGEILGQSRQLTFDLDNGTSILSDEDYRFLLKSAIVQNSWKGSVEEIYDIWNEIFPGVLLTIYDNQDMTCTLFFSGALEEVRYELLIHDLLLPKPVGVQYTYSYIGQKWFSYNMDDTFHAGYNEGYWNGGLVKIFAFDYDNDSSGFLAGLDVGVWFEPADPEEE